jgi:hypothetical protein
MSSARLVLGLVILAVFIYLAYLIYKEYGQGNQLSKEMGKVFESDKKDDTTPTTATTPSKTDDPALKEPPRPWNNCVAWLETTPGRHDDWCANDFGTGWKHVGQDGGGCTPGFGKGTCSKK